MNEPTTRELKIMLDNVIEKFNEKHADTMEVLLEIKDTTKDTSNKVGIQNGRVTKLETWSTEAQKIIEKTSEIATNYRVDRGRMLTLIAVLVLVGGTIVALVAKINNDRFERIETALSEQN